MGRREVTPKEGRGPRNGDVTPYLKEFSGCRRRWQLTGGFGAIYVTLERVGKSRRPPEAPAEEAAAAPAEGPRRPSRRPRRAHYRPSRSAHRHPPVNRRVPR